MNSICGLVKILEISKQFIFGNNLLMIKVRAQLPQIRNTQIVNLTFWGNLAHDVTNYYKENDYIIIEGYLSFNNQTRLMIQTSKKVEITVLKIYPILLNYEQSPKYLS